LVFLRASVSPWCDFLLGFFKSTSVAEADRATALCRRPKGLLHPARADITSWFTTYLYPLFDPPRSVFIRGRTLVFLRASVTGSPPSPQLAWWGWCLRGEIFLWRLPRRSSVK